MAFADIPQFLQNLAKNDALRKQRKMTDLNIAEVSGVDHPAHLHEGWLIKKSVDRGHDHKPGRHYLSEQETHTVNGLYGAEDLKPGDSKTLGASNLNREACGCLSLTTADSVAKAASDAWVESFQKAEAAKPANTIYSPAEIQFLLGDKK